MRVRLQRLWYWLTAQGPNLTFDQKLSRWVNVTAAISIVVTVGVWVVGWVLNLPWFVGVLTGLVAWVVILNGFVAYGRRAGLATDSTASPAAHAEDSTSPSPLPTDSEDVEQLSRELRKVEQELASANVRIAGQHEQLSEWEGVRQRFKHFLFEAWSEGGNLRGSDPSNAEAREWESCVRYLLEQAIGKEIAERGPAGSQGRALLWGGVLPHAPSSLEPP